jgi:FixJ family two-component response regulator
MDAETFNSADEFIDTGVSHEPDCLILDVQMPGMTGLDLCGQLAARKSRIPVIFITAHDAPTARETAAERGAVAYLTKPVDDQLLLDTIGKALVGKGSAEKRTGR